MVYGLQHNGKGKNHFIQISGDNDKELCGTAGVFNFTPLHDVELRKGVFFMLDHLLGESIIPDFILKGEYCKKCIKKAIKSEDNNEHMEIHKSG